MGRKIGILLQVPLWTLVFASIITGFYAAYNKISEISYGTPIILVIILGLYVYGRILQGSGEEENTKNGS